MKLFKTYKTFEATSTSDIDNLDLYDDIENDSDLDLNMDQDQDSGTKYASIKDKISKMIDESGDRKELFDKLPTESLEELNLIGLLKDSEIREFYIQNEFEIDEKLNEIDFFENPLVDVGVSTLADAVIKGTQIAILKFLDEIKEEEDF